MLMSSGRRLPNPPIWPHPGKMEGQAGWRSSCGVGLGGKGRLWSSAAAVSAGKGGAGRCKRSDGGEIERHHSHQHAPPHHRPPGVLTPSPQGVLGWEHPDLDSIRHFQNHLGAYWSCIAENRSTETDLKKKKNSIICWRKIHNPCRLQ